MKRTLLFCALALTSYTHAPPFLHALRQTRGPLCRAFATLTKEEVKRQKIKFATNIELLLQAQQKVLDQLKDGASPTGNAFTQFLLRDRSDDIMREIINAYQNDQKFLDKEE